MLDEDLRARLRATAERADAETASSNDEARRLAFLMGGEIRRQRVRRRVIGASTFGLVCAAASAFIMFRPEAAEPEVADHTPPRCASRAAPANAVASFAGTSRRDFDRRFRIATDEAARLHVNAEAPCDASLTLASGSVDVWARGLEGGALRVRVGSLRVEVVGTRFRVATTTEATWVHVAEGHVLVHRPGLPVESLTAGQSARFDEAGVTRTTLPADVRAGLATILEDTPRPTAAQTATEPTQATTELAQRARDLAAQNESAHETEPVSNDALVLQAEQAMREGRLDDARALFRRAGRAPSATGEAAWIRLARLELRAGRPREARSAIAEHDRRFRGGRLAAEALYVDSVAARSLGDSSAATAAEQRLLERFPDSAQAARIRARTGQ